MKPATDAKVWAFLGDGETDEPESLGAITLASREKLDNLIFVVNCNLQRLDGRCAATDRSFKNWNLRSAARAGTSSSFVGQRVGSIFERDTEGLLVKRMGELVDGEYQKLVVSSGAYVREHFFAAIRDCFSLLSRFGRGAAPPASRRARSAQGLRRVQGGRRSQRLADRDSRAHHQGLRLGEAGEGKNVTHSRRNSTKTSCASSARASAFPLNDEDCIEVPFYRPPEDSVEIQYLRARREALAGTFQAQHPSKPLVADHDNLFKEFLKEAMAGKFPRRWRSWACSERCLRIGDRQAHRANRSGRSPHLRHGIAFPHRRHLFQRGQRYEPVDVNTLLYYKEAKNDRFSKKASLRRAPWPRASPRAQLMLTHGINTIPFFITTRCSLPAHADFIWAAADMRMRVSSSVETSDALLSGEKDCRPGRQ